MGKFLTREDIIKEVLVVLSPPVITRSVAPKVSPETRNAIMQRLMGMARNTPQTPPSPNLGQGTTQTIPNIPPVVTPPVKGK